MRVAVFSSKTYDRQFLDAANVAAGSPHEFMYFEPRLRSETAALAEGTNAICVFVNDVLNREVLIRLSMAGIALIALRCAGFNNVDLIAAREIGLRVARVPAYSPWSVAEHTVAMILTLNRKIHRAYTRVREGNFSLDGLLGFDLHGRTVGIIGTGRIGASLARILNGFGCRLLGHDPVENEDFENVGGRYVALDELLSSSDVISLHCPLTPQTRHLIDAASVRRMKPGVMLINTSRGSVVETRALIDGLKIGKIGYLGLDVYEEEGDLFFEDLSGQAIQDDVFARLLTFPNVIVTGHQAFFTAEALRGIAEATVANISAFEKTGSPVDEVTAERHVRSAV